MRTLNSCKSTVLFLFIKIFLHVFNLILYQRSLGLFNEIIFIMMCWFLLRFSLKISSDMSLFTAANALFNHCLINIDFTHLVLIVDVCLEWLTILREVLFLLFSLFWWLLLMDEQFLSILLFLVVLLLYLSSLLHRVDQWVDHDRLWQKKTKHEIEKVLKHIIYWIDFRAINHFVNKVLKTKYY